MQAQICSIGAGGQVLVPIQKFTTKQKQTAAFATQDKTYRKTPTLAGLRDLDSSDSLC
jgi:hypothetical protein